MVFWQLTIDANDPARLARFWGPALGYRPTPPDADTTWYAHYRGRLDDGATAFDDRLFDPSGAGPALWFQAVPEARPAPGATVARRTRHDDPDDPVYYVVLSDPEGNDFCVGS